MAIRAASNDDANPRPLKRLRASPSPSPPPLKRLPPATLLLALPSLLIHPPSHKLHLQSISLSKHALRRCLALPGLQPHEECRAWTGLAELGMMWLDAVGDGVGHVEQAITKALLIAQKHPALRLYTPHLTTLSARLAQHHQSNPKFAAHTLRRLLSSLSLSPSTPPHVLFGAHLALVHSYAASSSSDKDAALRKCLAAVQDMHTAAAALSLPGGDGEGGTNLVALLPLVIRVQILVRHGLWAQVGEALGVAERGFDEYAGGERGESPSPQSQHPQPQPQPQHNHTLGNKTEQKPAIPPPLRIHLLIIGVLFHTYAGDATAASERLKTLHVLLDEGVSGLGGDQGSRMGEEDGVVEIPFPTHTATLTPHPLRIKTTPPRIVHALAFLVSAVAKRDAVGRAPKKGVFARAGLELRELQEGGGGTMAMAMARVKADLMCEVVAISTMRSSFRTALSTLNALIAHTRTHGLFPGYAARIALMHAQVAHASGDVGRALECYGVAEGVAEGGSLGCGEGEGEGERDAWIAAAARAGAMWVRVGVMRQRRQGVHDPGVGDRDGGEGEGEMEELRRRGGEVARECDGLGGTLMAVGAVLRACIDEEFTGAKQHLRRALDLATRAQDNHLRAVVLALVAAHYLHTAREHAIGMLGTCGQLAAGLGAGAKPAVPLLASSSSGGGGGNEKGTGEEVEAGNVPLRLWVGERVVELRRWAGEVGLAERQEGVNVRLREALGRIGR